MKRSWIKRGTKGLRRNSKIRVVGVSDTAVLKQEIQALLREIVMLRDGGCFLRHYAHRITPRYRYCSGWRQDGELILQAEHLHTRGSALAFSDSRLVVCVCRDHHIFYKKEHSAEYNELAAHYIGTAHAALWEVVRNDHRTHKADLKLEKIALEQELKRLKNSKNG